MKRIVLLTLMCGGCSTVSKTVGDLTWVKEISNWIEQKVGLSSQREFLAEDGKYFPAFINQTFPNATSFSKEHPSLAMARSGLKIIEVRQLNSKAERYNEANLSWSSDSFFLGFEVTTDHERKILVADLTGRFQRELSVLPKRRENFLEGMVRQSTHSYNAGLRWAQDGQRYAFMSNGGTGTYNIYVGDVSTKEQTIAQSQTKDGYATWSPDGKEIAFVSGRSGNGDLYLVDTVSEEVTQLTKSPAVDIFPDWSSQGNRIVYASGDATQHHITLMTRTKRSWSNPQRLTLWSHDDLRPTFSPDGRHIAFYSNCGESNGHGSVAWDLLVIPADTNPLTDQDLQMMRVARDVVVDLNTGPAWTPDSRKLIFVKNNPEEFNPIHAYDLYSGRSYVFDTKTRMNRDILMSRIGVLSFRAQVGVWDRVFVALTNQGAQLHHPPPPTAKIHYLR